MTKKKAQRKRKKEVPVLWAQQEDFEVVATARPPDSERPWQQCGLLIHLSEGDTTRVVRQQVRP